MKKLLIAAALFCASSLTAFSQGIRFDSRILTTVNKTPLNTSF